MTTEDKNIARETARWLRVGVLSLSVLGPMINSIVVRLREQAQTVSQSRAITQSQEKLAAVGATLAERGSGLSHEIAERGDVLYHELAKRGDVLSHEMAKRGELVTREVNRRRHDARALARRNSRWLALAGFGLGATGTGIAAYLFIRRRMLQQMQEEEEQFILPEHGLHNGTAHIPQYSRSNMAPSTTRTEAIQVVERPEALIADDEAAEDSKGNGGIEKTETEGAAAHDVRFLGVASTHRYYPASTPLDALQTPDSQPIDVVYFATEDEAKAQGFTSA